MSTCDLATVVPDNLSTPGQWRQLSRNFLPLRNFLSHGSGESFGGTWAQRRLSAMGREDSLVSEPLWSARRHQSHYDGFVQYRPRKDRILASEPSGLLCPINEFGFVETPYRKVVVKNGKPLATKKSNIQRDSEDRKVIAQPNPDRWRRNIFWKKKWSACEGKLPLLNQSSWFCGCFSKTVHFSCHGAHSIFGTWWCSPALMGSNMQRQAVSCILPQSPLVGTGLEDKPRLIQDRDSREDRWRNCWSGC